MKVFGRSAISVQSAFRLLKKGPMSAQQISEETGFGQSSVDRALKRLVVDGEVFDTGKKTKNCGVIWALKGVDVSGIEDGRRFTAIDILRSAFPGHWTYDKTTQRWSHEDGSEIYRKRGLFEGNEYFWDDGARVSAPGLEGM